MGIKIDEMGNKMDVKTIRAKPDEVILLTYEPEEYQIGQVLDMIEEIKRHYPNNEVLILPQNVQLKTANIDQLLQISDSIDHVIFNLRSKPKITSGRMDLGELWGQMYAT